MLNSLGTKAWLCSELIVIILILMPNFLLAQAARRDEGSWQHSDGIWWGWQRSAADPVEQSFFLIDDGNVQLTRGEAGQNQLSRMNWTLGLGKDLNRFILLKATSSLQRALGRHQLSLDLDGGGSLFLGSTRFTGLEDQFLTNNGVGFSDGKGRTDRVSSDINLADRIALTRSLDLTLDANHQESRVDVNAERQSQSIVQSLGSRVEQRWLRGSLQASARKTELELRSQLGVLPNLSKSQQEVLDMQARLIYPILGHFSGSLGWQDLQSKAPGVDDLRLSGPELGLLYTPFASWSGFAFVRVLKEDGNQQSEGQIFGEANLAWRSDSSNNFVFTTSKQIDLLTSYRIFTAQSLVSTEAQRSTVSSQLQWLRQRGRYRLNLSLSQSRQEFEQSRNRFEELSLTQGYSLSRLIELDLTITESLTRFLTDASTAAARRQNLNAKLGWQHILPGGLRPFGARSFYRLDLSYENLQERILSVRAERLTFLASIGQIGNF